VRGPRCLTPVFALWWVFVPAAAAVLRRALVVVVLARGAPVQLLALSADPQRLLLARAIPFNYYLYDSWVQFHPAASHLLQRPQVDRGGSFLPDLPECTSLGFAAVMVGLSGRQLSATEY
jgi:hypothetical protein